MSESGS
jgi:L-rhamnose mutarotase